MRELFSRLLSTKARVFFALLFIGFTAACTKLENSAQQNSSLQKTTEQTQLHAAQIKQTLLIDGEVDSAWALAQPLVFNTDWSGTTTSTQTQVRALWSANGLYLLWELDGAGLRNTDHRFPLNQERDGLYDEDCVELFIAPDSNNPYAYAEIEVGPYGHYMDLWINRRMRSHDSSWSSNLSVATKQYESDKRVVIEMEIRAPKIARALVAGAQLPIGLYRLEGAKPRQYLAAFPTRTKVPEFHVPEAFSLLVLNP